jgi:hypothetical protein
MKLRRYIQTLIVVLITMLILCAKLISFQEERNQLPAMFLSSVDTMKYSRDTVGHPLSQQEIASIIKATAQLNTSYITVDTQWDYPAYMEQWIRAIRAVKRHIWFRIYPRQWEDTGESGRVMTPAQYLLSERAFIQEHPSFFQAGDILDPCAEPEQGVYWNATYGANWTSNAPDAATVAYNLFLRQTTNIAAESLRQQGITGVITTIRSINSFIATHPLVLEQETVDQLGVITVDSYPEQDTMIPAVAARARVAELNTIESLWHVPIVIGEMGYSNQVPVDDTVQQAVLKEEFAQLQSLPYLIGMNYWVGPGSATAGGYTYILTQKDADWALRPAAYDLATFDHIMAARK